MLMYPNNQQPGQPYPQPTPQPTPQQQPQNPYGFIYDAPHNAKRPFSPPGGMKGRIALVAGGLILLIMLIVVAVSLFTGSDDAVTQRYVDVAKRQTEIIRITTLGEEKATSLQTRSFAATTRLGLTTAQSDMTALLDKKGVSGKELSKQLSASKNSKSDEALEQAQKNGRFDEVFTDLLENELANYKKEINAAAGSATKSEKKTLQTAFDQATLLLPEKN